MHLVSGALAGGTLAGRLPAAQVGPRQQGACLCRRNGKLGLSGMAIADITLLSGFHALRADLEKVWLAAQRDPLCLQEPWASTTALPGATPGRGQGPRPPPRDHLPFFTADLPL